MIESRLVTGGCSFTDYMWHTWADYLGSSFGDYLNVGQAGSDNANIARNIIGEARANDTVVILWSGWNRQLKWDPNGHPVPKNEKNHWQYSYERWDKNWLVNFYDPNERLASSLDYVRMVDLHSKVNGYIAYHFSAFPWKLGEIEKNPPRHFDFIFDQYDIDNNFLLATDMETYQKENGFDKIIPTEYNKGDRHPSPLCHYRYLKDIIIKNLNLDINLDIDSMVMDHQESTLNGFPSRL